MAIAVGVLVIAVVLGSLWFFGKNFHSPQLTEDTGVIQEPNTLPEGWAIFIADGMTIAHPGAPWIFSPISEGAIFKIEQPGEAVSKARITVSTIPVDTSFEEAIMEDVTYSPSGNKPEDISEFDLLVVGGRTWYVTQIELFEAQSVRVYYLKRSDTQAVKVELFESEITDWMEPSFKPGDTEVARTLEDMITFLSI